MSLLRLNDDTFFGVFAILTIPDIQAFRRVCRRVWLLSVQHIVWQNAYKNYILAEKIPFPRSWITSFSAAELERWTMHAYHLAQNLRSSNPRLRHLWTTSSSRTIEEMKFLKNRGKTWIVTISRGIWPTLLFWDCTTMHVVGEWSPGKALFDGIVINTDTSADAVIAVFMKCASDTVTHLFSIVSEDNVPGVSLRCISTLSFHTRYKPITLHGDIIALSDHDSETIARNWITGKQCLLCSPDTWLDSPLHVAFIPGHIVVIRARSVRIFKEPCMQLQEHPLLVNLPCASASFGWVDGISLSLATGLHGNICSLPSSILVRTKGDNPWSSEHQFQLFRIDDPCNMSLIPIPKQASQAPAPALVLVSNLSCPNRGPLDCTDMVLGCYGTAAWVLPANRFATGLISDRVGTFPATDSLTKQTLVIAAFPGSFNASNEVQIKVSIENEDSSPWTSCAYDEECGLVALGSSAGDIMLYSL